MLALALQVVAGAALTSSPAPQKVQVFVLAGQSNMEGKAKVSLLESHLADSSKRAEFVHLQEEGDWIERADVSIRFHDRHGPLTVGYGSPNCIGPELGFGLRVGDATEAPVLLVKTAWGGKSLARDFRPPSAGLPAAAKLEALLENERKRHPERTLAEVEASHGAFYREMLSEVRATLDDLETYVPGYAGQGYELAGFVWFQGWNDMIDDERTAEYAENLAHLIRDVRRDLETPGLPFVIGQFGVGGVANDDAKHLRFKAAQAAPAALPEFEDDVALVATDRYWDLEAQAVFDKGWREHLEEWTAVGSDYPYHYLGSVRTQLAMGDAFAVAALALRATRGE